MITFRLDYLFANGFSISPPSSELTFDEIVRFILKDKSKVFDLNNIDITITRLKTFMEENCCNAIVFTMNDHKPNGKIRLCIAFSSKEAALLFKLSMC